MFIVFCLWQFSIEIDSFWQARSHASSTGTDPNIIRNPRTRPAIFPQTANNFSLRALRVFLWTPPCHFWYVQLINGWLLWLAQFLIARPGMRTKGPN